jgi:hypothetical protein
MAHLLRQSVAHKSLAPSDVAVWPAGVAEATRRQLPRSAADLEGRGRGSRPPARLGASASPATLPPRLCRGCPIDRGRRERQNSRLGQRKKTKQRAETTGNSARNNINVKRSFLRTTDSFTRPRRGLSPEACCSFLRSLSLPLPLGFLSSPPMRRPRPVRAPSAPGRPDTAQTTSDECAYASDSIRPLGDAIGDVRRFILSGR